MPPRKHFSGGEEGIIHGKKIPLVSGAMGTLRSVSVVVRGRAFRRSAYVSFSVTESDRRSGTESARGDHPAPAEGKEIPGYHPVFPTDYTDESENLAHGIFPCVRPRWTGEPHTWENHPRGGNLEIRLGDPDRISLHRQHTLFWITRRRAGWAFSRNTTNCTGTSTGDAWSFPSTRRPFPCIFGKGPEKGLKIEWYTGAGVKRETTPGDCPTDPS
jgi:hypothetical protein